VFKDFPLPNHAQAPKASEAAHCAGEQGKYWEMHDRIFANQQSMGVPVLKQHAIALGLNAAAFDQCLDSGKHAASIAEDMKLGESLGVQSTPTIYINGRPVIGAQSYEYFQNVVDEELARK
jgi:protein-disulfide isomerase